MPHLPAKEAGKGNLDLESSKVFCKGQIGNIFSFMGCLFVLQVPDSVLIS